MYLVVITDEHLKIHNAVTFEDTLAVRIALSIFGPERGFSTLVFKLNTSSDIYEEIFPEVLDYDN